jgi:hypothetical protein
VEVQEIVHLLVHLKEIQEEMVEVELVALLVVVAEELTMVEAQVLHQQSVVLVDKDFLQILVAHL